MAKTAISKTKSDFKAAAAYGGLANAKKYTKDNSSKPHKLKRALVYETGQYFGEFEAFDAAGLMNSAGEPLAEYKPKGGKAAGSVVAAERCEVIVMRTRHDIRMFKHCLMSSTLDVLDQMLTVGQYGRVDEDALSRLAVFGREKHLKAKPTVRAH